jgi:hypothetical protein
VTLPVRAVCAHPWNCSGIKVLAHKKAAQRESWSTHAFVAWYIGPALNHYRCYTVWATKTRQERIVNQLMWFPPKPFPRLTSEDLLRATIEDFENNPTEPPSETSVGNMEQIQRGELIQLSKILHHQTPTSRKSLYIPKDPASPLGVPPTADPAPALGVEPEAEPRRSARTPRPPARYRTHFCAPAINPDMGADAKYKELIKSSAGKRWLLAMCKELGRLFQGFTCKLEAIHTVKGTNTCVFISSKDIPKGKKATYIRIVAELRP